MDFINKLLFKLHIKKRPASIHSKKGSLPEPVKNALEKEGLDTSEIITFFRTDMTSAEKFGDVFVLFDKKGVYVAEFTEEVRPKKKGNKKLEFKPELLKLTAIPIDEIDEIFAEKYLATGQLTYKKDDEYYSLGYFSISLLGLRSHKHADRSRLEHHEN